jgi:hypothetical protein
MRSSAGSLPKLELVGEDGNAFFILGRAHRAYRDHHRKLMTPHAVIDAGWEKIKAEATSGDYDHLLGTMMKHFDVS